jgi:ADP-ribose pyrophosphatase
MEAKRWERLSSKKLLSHPRLSVYEDEVRLCNNQTSTYIHYGDNLDSVVIIPVSNDGKILLLKEYSYPPDRWLFQFPGGALNQHETPKAGAARELSEEANIKGKLSKLGWFYPDFRRKNEKQFVFVATDTNPEPGIKDLEEEFEFHWLTETEIDRMIKNNQILTFNTLAAWTFYKNK